MTVSPGGCHFLISDLAYRPVTTYQRAVPATVAWLVEATGGHDWEAVLPASATLLGGQFDYDAEDAFLAGLNRV